MKGEITDERFSKAFRDQRFRPIRQRQKKIQIDKRFQSMFSDKKFKVSYTHDKRGRPVKESSSENLKRYYQLSHEEKKRIKQERIKKKRELSKKLGTEENQEEKHDKDTADKDEEVSDHESLSVQKKEAGSDISSSEDDSSSDDEDLARGRGNIESSSSEESEGEDFVNNYTDSTSMEHEWGELDGSAPRSEDVSSRLALCNMDWDRLKLQDVMVVMNSFKPAGGTIKRISLYLSDFGASRIKEENESGPAELRGGGPTGANAIPIGAPMPDKKFEERFQIEKLRKYQINRLKYYFVVIECDSADTAEHIYTECDGREFETSCSRMDLRFIPDEQTFDDREPKETLTSVPDLDTYKPSDFTTSALNQTKVELTWDETNYERTKITMRKFKKEELEEMDVRDFLASSSGSESDGDDVQVDQNKNITEVKKFKNEEERIQHFRNLLLGEQEERSDHSDVDMEVTWEPNLLNQEEKSDNESEHDSADHAESDNNDLTENIDKEKAELEMIMMEDDKSDSKHFNMDDIVEKHKLNKKRKKKKDAEILKDDDDFKLNVDDDRFSALYTSGVYSIDKSNPKYRKTEGMETLINERQKRVKNLSNKKVADPSSTNNTNDEINSLIKSIKAKTSNSWKSKTKNVKK